jgi:hypothetical protein
MTYLIKPRGRGNWRAICVEIEGDQFPVGSLINIGSRCYWVISIVPQGRPTLNDQAK